MHSFLFMLIRSPPLLSSLGLGSESVSLKGVVSGHMNIADVLERVLFDSAVQPLYQHLSFFVVIVVVSFLPRTLHKSALRDPRHAVR